MAHVLSFPRSDGTTSAKVLGKVVRRPPAKPLNKVRRTREHLTPAEVAKLAKAAASLGRHGFRDGVMVRFAYRHGLRVGELVGVQWSDIDLTSGTFHVRRLKNGVPSTHPLQGSELRELKALRRRHPESPFLFVTERGGPMVPRNFAAFVARAGEEAGLPFPVHPHMLRHATGYALASEGQDTRSLAHYLGHRSLESTAIYTALDPGRFRNFWRGSR